MIFHENGLPERLESSARKIIMKYHGLIFQKVQKDVAKFAVCCSRAWCFDISGRKVVDLSGSCWVSL